LACSAASAILFTKAIAAKNDFKANFLWIALPARDHSGIFFSVWRISSLLSAAIVAPILMLSRGNPRSCPRGRPQGPPLQQARACQSKSFANEAAEVRIRPLALGNQKDRPVFGYSDGSCRPGAWLGSGPHINKGVHPPKDLAS